MDIFAHFFWTYALFHKTKKPYLTAFFGILPDLLSFGLLFMINIFSGKSFFTRGPPDPATVPSFITQSYNYTHSLIIFAIILLIIYLLTKKFYIFLLGWPFHILLDIPTHTNRLFPTPFLFPISNYVFNGISWGNPIFIKINYSLLLLTYIFIFRKNIAKLYKSLKR
ncbi:MAG: hypothetical protein AABW45_00835 [Nanoarchaeota archaeon]